MSAWTAEEIATAGRGDERLNPRYRRLLDQRGGPPARSIPAACHGRAEGETADRFFDNPRVSEAGDLASHVGPKDRAPSARPNGLGSGGRIIAV